MNNASLNNGFAHERGVAMICTSGAIRVALRRAAGDGRFIH